VSTAPAEDEATRFFADVTESFTPAPDHCSVVVCHALPTAVAFVPAIDGLAKVVSVLPKPKSMTDERVREQLQNQFSVEPLRERRSIS
jgi:hypothetical protein